MLHTPRATRGMVVAPHHLAAQAGLRVLREGGNAIEAMVAAAATIAVVYPHMNSLGGDNFWLLTGGDGAPTAIDACGSAASAVSIDLYRSLGYENIPARGPLAAITVAGAVSGWAAALDVAARWGGRLPVARLLEDAIYYANAGVPTTRSQHQNTADHLDELLPCPGFAEVFLTGDQAPSVGTPLRQPRLATTLEQLARTQRTRRLLPR